MKYQDHPQIQVVYGENIGACNSFLWLIDNAPISEYYSFSDQDDVWIKDKLATAISKLIISDSVLYHGLAGRVDASLRPLDNIEYKPKDSFGASLMSSATGCTMVFSHRLMEKVKSYIPQKVSMHDAWLYRVCYALDYPVYYDSESHILYRQHEHNVSGGEMSFKKKLRMIKKNKGLKYHVAEEIKKGFAHEMPKENIKILNTFLNYQKSLWGKIKVCCSSDYNLINNQTNIQNKVLFILNYI